MVNYIAAVVMSFCYFHGILPVSEGRRVQSVRTNGSTVWHAMYDTLVMMEAGSELDGVFRAFSPASVSLMPSDTLIIANGKFSFPSTTEIRNNKPVEFIIEPTNFVPFTMDLSLDGSDSFLPLDDVPSLNLLGSVVGAVVHFNDGGKGVDVRVSNFIQGTNLDSVYRSVNSLPLWILFCH